MTPAERLKKIRGDKSQKEMAALLGINYRTYENYEKGLNDPSWSACEAIAKLGFNANWLLTGEGEMRRGAVEYPLGETLKNGDILSDTVKVAATAAPPRINGVGPVKATDQPFAWFHEWIDEELVGKSMSEVMRFAVKIKAELDKEREG